MKNLLIRVAIIGLLAASGALADGVFIGFEGGYNFKTEIESVVKDKSPEFSIKAGYDFGMARAYGGYSYQLKAEDKFAELGPVMEKDEWTTHDFIMGADFTPQISDNFKFIIGAYSGSSIISLKSKGYYDGKLLGELSTTQVGWLIGARLGGAVMFDKNNELEFGFKASKTWYLDDGEYEGVEGTKYGAYLGYNYKFSL